MSWTEETTPLRLRLGPRSEVPLQPVSPIFEDIEPASSVFEDIDPASAVFEEVDTAADEATLVEDEAALAPDAATETPEGTVGEVAATPVESRDALRTAPSQELQRAVEQTAERVERWMADQRRRLGLSIDAMVASLVEQRDAEMARIDEWKLAERERAERQLTEEKERFHAQLLTELVEFEQQLGGRLREQEERLAKWWDEAEQLTKQRFAELGLAKPIAASDSPEA